MLNKRFNRSFKILSSSLLTAMTFFLLSIPVLTVLAAAFSATISIMNSSTTAYLMLPSQALMNNKWMSQNGFMASNSLDTQVVNSIGGSQYPHMVADDRLLAALPAPASSQVNAFFTTGNAPAAAQKIIVGNGGILSTGDDATLEPSTVWSLDLKGYIDLSGAVDALPIMSKRGSTVGTSTEALRVQTAESGTIVVEHYGTITTPSSSGTASAEANLGGANWYAQTFTAGATYRISSIGVGLGQFSGTSITGNPGPLTASIYATSAGAPTGTALTSATLPQAVLSTAQVALFYVPPIIITNGVVYAIVFSAPAGSGGNVYQLTQDAAGGFAGGNRYSSTNSGVTWTSAAGTDLFFNIKYATYLVATGITTGERELLIEQVAGPIFRLTVDGVLKDSQAYGTAVLNNANDWIWNAPYWYFIKQTVGAGNTLRYEPNNMVHGIDYSTGTAKFTNGLTTVLGTGTTWTSAMAGGLIQSSASAIWYTVASVTNATTLVLSTAWTPATTGSVAYVAAPGIPNRESATGLTGAYITWGTNAAGITMTTGSMLGSNQLVTIPTSTPVVNALPVITVSDWFKVPDVGGTLIASPFRPFVTMVSDNTTLNESQVWSLYGFFIIILVAVGTARLVGRHQLITGIATSAAIIACVAYTVWPLWALVFVVLSIIGGAIAERSLNL